MRRCAAAAVVIACVAGAGCPSRVGDAKDLAVSSDTRARAVVEAALVELREGRLEVVLARFCDQSDPGLARARQVLAPAVGRHDLAIRRVEPAWVGAEPFFYVEVAARPGDYVHGLGVQVKTGCLERAVGAPDAADGETDDDGPGDGHGDATGPSAPPGPVDAGSLGS